MLNPEKLCPGCMSDSNGEQVCSLCGFDRADDNRADELPVFSRLAERFMVGRIISRSSEGAVYLGWDNSTDTAVNIKEYFPLEAAVRNPDKTVSMAEGMEFAYNEGLMEFMELNRSLIDSSLPSLIPVLSVFEENGTAYAVSEVFSGITLKSFLERNGGSLKWEQARPLFLPLIDTVKGLNAAGIVHGGISPETVVVGRDGKLRISNICISAVRQRGREIPEILYEGYAAAEQYGYDNLSVGQYTDVYGLSATLFRVLIGAAPPAAESRVENDSLTIPARFADELPRQVLVSLANGLQVLPKDRSSAVEVLKNELVYGETEENARRAAAGKKAAAAAKNAKSGKAKKGSSAKYAVLSALCTALLFAAIAAILCLTVFKEQIFGAGSSDVGSSEESIAAPSVDMIGDVDSDAAASKQLYTVPDFSGEFYSAIIENDEYERFEFTIKNSMEFSDKYPKGTVCAQSVAAGTAVEKDTKIELTVSLGSKEIKIANVEGLDEENAKIELLKQGFLYENIEVVPKYDSDSKPGIVLEQSPEYGSKVGTNIAVRIYINSYEGEESSSELGYAFE